MSTFNRMTFDRTPWVVRYAVPLFVLEGLVLAQLFFAYQDGFFTVAQMRARGIEYGLPFAAHLAMWSDLVLISPLAAYLISCFCGRWSIRSMIGSLAIGVITSVLLHWLYTTSAMPEAHVQNHQLTRAGWLHGLYMALAVAVFSQFYLFTRDLPSRLVGLVSVLLLVHVFIGTHMVLGLFTLVFPQAWYPAQPLTNIAGWGTIGILATALGWFNYKFDRFRGVGEIARGLGRWLYRMYVYWTGQDDRTTEGFLKLLDNFCGWIGPLYLAAVMFGHVSHADELENGWLAISLAALICLIYFFGRHSAKRELLIARELFVPGHVPDDYATPKNRLLTGVIVVCFIVVFCLMVRFADYIWFVAPVMFVAACNDYRTRYQINKNMRRYFNSDVYAVPPSYTKYDTIMRKRDVAKWFLFDADHLAKETVRAFFCGAAAILAIAGYIRNDHSLTTWAYVVLISTLLVNEILTGYWRYRREARLAAIKS